MIRIDLAAAGVPNRDADNRVADFHAFCRSFITLLERSGVSPKLAQGRARYSDIRLSMKVYTHARLHDLAGAVDGLAAQVEKRTGLNSFNPQGGEAGCDSLNLGEVKLPGQDSNLDEESQNLLCYRYTTG